MVIIRKISITVLLLATLSLLINSILPHHHHSEEVCFESSHCENDHADHQEGEFEPEGVDHNNHSHEADFCQIIDFYLTSDGKNLNGKIKLKSVKKNFSINAFLYSKEVDLVCNNYSQENIYVGDRVGINSKSLTRALRAPPCA